MTKGILYVFVVQFIGLAVAGFFGKNTGMMLYGLGGAILNAGVMLMN